MTVLHVDESGAFEGGPDRDADADVVVAAWGVRREALFRVERAVRLEAERRWPWLPWPLHMAHLHEPSWLVLCHGAWCRRRMTGGYPDALARAGLPQPVEGDAFRATVARLRSFAAEFGLGEEWHALHAWGARQGFVLHGQGSERLRFCRRADEALAWAEAATRATARGRSAADALEAAIDRIGAGLALSVEESREFDGIFFPGGVPRDMRRAMEALLDDVLGLLHVAAREAVALTGSRPDVLLAAEAEPHGAEGEPDRYLALLRSLLSVVAALPHLEPTGLRVEGRRVGREAAEGRGTSPLDERDLARLLAAFPDHRWDDPEVYDKGMRWAECEAAVPRASQVAAAPGLLGRRPGTRGHRLAQAGRERLGTWPPGLVLADFAAFELRHRLGLDRASLIRFVEEELGASFSTGGALHAGAFPGASPDAARPWARRLP